MRKPHMPWVVRNEFPLESGGVRGVGCFAQVDWRDRCVLCRPRYFYLWRLWLRVFRGAHKLRRLLRALRRRGRIRRTPMAWVKKNAKKYNFDTNRVVMYGGSAGGHLASPKPPDEHPCSKSGEEHCKWSPRNCLD